MNKYKFMKRMLAIVLSAAMVFTNIGHTPTVAYAASGNSVDFMVSGADFVAAIEDMIYSGAEPLKQEELDFTNGKAEKYYQFFFDGEEPLYEFYPEFDGQDMEAEVRVFVRLPEAVDDTYSLTGEEEIIFLYINNSEDTISCSTTISMSDGSEKRTKRVTVKDYETAFGDNRIEYKSSTSAADQTEAEVPESDAAENEKPGTDAPMVETPETSMEESGVTESETEAGIPDQETEETENEAVETDEVIEDTKPEIVEKSEPETQSPDVSEEGETQADSPVASHIRHAVPVVAAADTGEENSAIEPSVDKQQEDTEISEADDDSENHSNDKDNETVDSVPKESSAEAESATESLTEESGNQTEASVDATGEEETTAVESSEPSTDIQTPSEESRTETSEETQTETSAETQPVESESVQGTETEESQIPAETEGAPVGSIGNGDLVGMDGCSTAKAYVTTLKKLKVLDDVDGYRITYEITPQDKAAIAGKCDRVEAGGSVTFGVEGEEGFIVGQVEVNGDVLESAYSEENTMWYTLEYVEEDLEILITMVPDGSSMPFNKTISMDDGMDITISALPGVLPEDTEVTAEIVTAQVEEAIKADQLAEGREIIAAPAYDINLCLDGEKLDDEIWNRNGAVTVSFSGPLMDQLIQASQMAQVLWVKDEDNSTEVMEGSYKDITREGTTEDLSFETSHFTTFAAVFAAAPDTSNVFNIDEHGLMDKDFPKLVVRDKNENTLDIEITEQEDGARRVTLKDGKPLPRNISTWFEISYDFKNSPDPFFETYSVQKGDHFTYQFPSNILYDKKQTVVKDINGGEAVIGTASINAEGYMDVEITAENVGQNYRGTAEAGGKLDLEKVLEEKNEITLVGDEVEYIMELVPAPVQENYSVKVVKGPKSGKWTDQDIRYDENKLPSALQYHVTVTADAQNSGPITNVKISDTLGNTKNGTIVFDKTQEIQFESNNQDTVIDNVTFGGMSNGGKTIGIQLNTKDGKPASMMPGESVSLSYWVKLGAGAWSGQNTGNSTKEMSASLSLELKNTVNVTADKKVSGSDSTTFKRTIECVTKSGIVHYNYEIDGKTEPVVIEYHVFVNPRLINMTGWTIEDKLDKNQKYLGNVEVIAYTGKNGTLLGKVDDIEPIITKNPQTWNYVIESPGNYYYDFKYFTTPNEATESNLSNQIKVTWPGGGSGGIGGSTGVGFLYNTYTMTKKNLSSNMKSSNNINSGGVYEPVKDAAGNVGWGDEFGTIRWQSVLTPYADGQTKGAMIPAGTVYKDTLSVIKWGNNKEDTARANMHTFKDGGSFKASFVMKDGNGSTISPDDGTYTLSFDDKLGNRGFDVVFSKDVPGPVTIEYESYVDLEMLENVGAVDKDGTKNNLRFKNVGEMTINGATWKSATSQPYYIEDYISKNWVKNDTTTGTITWNLNINKGYGNDAPQKLGRFTVDVIEYIPEGLTLDRIKFQSMNYTLKPEKGDYDIDGNKVTIHLNTVAKNFSGYKMSNHINLNIITKVTDPSIKSFTNSAQMVIDGNMLHKVSATTGFDKSFLKKGMAYSRDTAPYAEYTILVNQPGADISNGTLTVIDTLGVPGKMAYVPDSFKVTNAENGAPIDEANIRVGKDSFGNDSFEISNLPNKTPIKIFYKVMITGAIGETVDTKNTASLLYSREGIITETIERSVTIVKAAFTGGGNFSIKLYKVDQNKQPLTGAAFTLSKVSEVGSTDLEYVGEFTPVIDSGNPQAGAAVLITGLEKGQLYYLEETTVPEGYQKAEGEYFIIPDRENGKGVPDGAIAIENAGTPHVVENIKDSGTLKLTKEVNGRESDSDFETDFYFTVYDGNRYYDKDGSYADLRTVKLHYDSGIADNSLILSLPIGEYVVEEVADADGTPVNSDNFYYHVQINGEDRNEAVIAIEKEQQAECLVKNVYEAEGNLQFTAAKTMEGRPLEEGEFTFRIYEGDTLKAEAQNGAGGVILFPEINYKADDAGRHTYTIMEQKGTLTDVDYDDTVYTVTVEVTDNHDRTVSAEIVNIQRSDGNEAEVVQFNNVYHENQTPTPDPSPNPNPDPDPSPSPGGSTGGGGGTSNTGGGRYQPSDGGPGVTISIAPEEVPMAQIPSQPDTLIRILDDDVPLAPLPKTGDMSVNHYMLTAISMLLTGLYLALTKRKRE